jgi:hypothetical protein
LTLARWLWSKGVKVVGKGAEAAFVAIAHTDAQLLRPKIDVLDPEPDGFDDTSTAAV